MNGIIPEVARNIHGISVSANDKNPYILALNAFKGVIYYYKLQYPLWKIL